MSERPDLELVLESTDRLTSIFISEGKRGLSDAQRRTLGVWLLDAEVNNGGFDLFFHNSAGSLTFEAIEGLKEIGATETASILAAAAADFPGGRPSEDIEKRRRQLDQLQASPAARLDGLDHQFYDSGEDLVALLATYIRRAEGNSGSSAT